LKTNNILTVIKGVIIGGTMLVPGVSGGSMAMTLGIYNELITSISTIRRMKRQNIIFLALFILGAAVGMLIFANPILALIDRYPKPTIFFFLGAVAGAVPMIYRHSKVTTLRPKHVVYIAFGVLTMILMSFIPTDLIHTSSENGFLWFLLLLVAGFISAVAFILPGISFSYFLLLLGLYDATMTAIGEMDVMFLLPLVLGLAIGILVSARVLDRFMKVYPHATYLIILGFVVGSLIEAFPGVPRGIEWLTCILTASTGFAAIFLMSRKD